MRGGNAVTSSSMCMKTTWPLVSSSDNLKTIKLSSDIAILSKHITKYFLCVLRGWCTGVLAIFKWRGTPGIGFWHGTQLGNLTLAFGVKSDYCKHKATPPLPRLGYGSNSILCCKRMIFKMKMKTVIETVWGVASRSWINNEVQDCYQWSSCHKYDIIHTFQTISWYHTRLWQHIDKAGK